MTLWSRRTSPAQGNYWKAERDVTEQTAQDWLKVFRDDEPLCNFVVSKRKPSDKKNA